MNHPRFMSTSIKVYLFMGRMLFTGKS